MSNAAESTKTTDETDQLLTVFAAEVSRLSESDTQALKQIIRMALRSSKTNRVSAEERREPPFKQAEIDYLKAKSEGLDTDFKTCLANQFFAIAGEVQEKAKSNLDHLAAAMINYKGQKIMNPQAAVPTIP